MRRRVGPLPRCISVRAAYGGEASGPSPAYRAQQGAKHFTLPDGADILLATSVTEANVHDVTQLLLPLDAIPPVTGKSGSPQA
jgi:hypothetical protein